MRMDINLVFKRIDFIKLYYLVLNVFGRGLLKFIENNISFYKINLLWFVIGGINLIVINIYISF